MDCSPADVFEVLADGWVFPTWVVGASRMRDVEEGWPEAGTQLAHSFGVWPVMINDETTSIEWDPPRRVVFSPQGWPIGEALVEIDVKPRGDGCVVRIKEKAVAGPGAMVPPWLLDIFLFARNKETLQRLAYIAEGRRRPGSSSERA